MSTATFDEPAHRRPLHCQASRWLQTLLLKKNQNSKGPGNVSARPELNQQADLGEEKAPRALLCAHCHNPITHSRESCSIGGDSEHHCVNPAGILFHIQCFRTAPGCTVLGPSTMEDTWFTGYHWQMAYCNQCQSHMGWHYAGAGPGFFGLIKNRLIHEKTN